MTRPTFPRPRAFVRLLSLSLAALAMGCANGKYNYTGVEPTVRTFNENAELRDYYVGFDANFIVEDEAPHYHVAPATTRPISQY
jgi:hypothetical protein